MPILFSVIACDKRVVSKFATCDGNFVEISERMVSKIPVHDHKMTYLHGKYLIHYVVHKKNIFLCITEKTCQRSRAFLFLNQIQRRFTEYVKNFEHILAEEMYRYNEDYSTIVIRNGELDELNRISVESSETILGEKMLLVDNIDSLSYSTISYVGRAPEQISISVQDKKRFNFIFIGIFMIIVGSSVYVFGPISCVTATVIIVFTFIRSLYVSKNKTHSN
ncbi:vesicle-associated membrane protein 7-like [Bombyx mandarina]|uniref:Vesicle-associated membrane protein 7-like n=1 Tax=Bombyx mandarina TaxID=7092 RepID=A0A6J2JGY9_BOMMA|nr:vesicle-associated membrane protein 7-like [Bombyx mandarina]